MPTSINGLKPFAHTSERVRVQPADMVVGEVEVDEDSQVVEGVSVDEVYVVAIQVQDLQVD